MFPRKFETLERGERAPSGSLIGFSDRLSQRRQAAVSERPWHL